MVFLISWQIMVMPFHTPPMDYMCKPKIVGTNDTTDYDSYTYQDWSDIATRLNSGEAPTECEVMEYTPNVSLVPTSAECDSWVYDTSTFTSSIISDFDLVCDKRYLVTLSQSMALLGAMFGSIIIGVTSDL